MKACEVDKRKFLALPLEQRSRLWKKQDEQLEAYCREKIELRERPVVVEVPDAWTVALGYCDQEERRRTRRTGKKRESKPKAKRPPATRLNPDDIRDLKEYLCYFEGSLGVRSTWPEQAEGARSTRIRTKYKDGKCEECGCKHAIGARHDSHQTQPRGPTHGGEPSYDMNLIGIVMSREMEAAGRVRNTLVEMVDRGWQDSVRHLWRVYGPQQRFNPFPRFGDLAFLIDQTPLADRLSKEFGVPHSEAVEKRLRMDGADLVSERLRDLAEKMLCLASERYRQCRQS